MSRFSILFLPLFIGAVVPAFAAGNNTITVIQEDGTKVTVEIEPLDPVLPGPAPLEEPSPPPEPPKPVMPTEIAPAPYVDEIIAPREEPKTEKAEKPPAKEKDKKTVKREAAKKKAPPPKKYEEGSYEYVIPEGVPITETLAASIAMDSAPPSSGYTVSRRSYEGKNVIVVTFKTEDGPYDVLVDSVTGKVLLSAYVENLKMQPTKPGHLPADWEPFTPQPVGNAGKK